MLKVEVFSAKGIKTGQVTLPAFNEDRPNLFTLSQAIRVYEDRSHPGLAKVQTRAEVNRTKKKVYRQKGTGGARHGARSAPIYVGGGVAHGPKGIKRRLILPVNIARKALKAAVTIKAKSGELFVVSGLQAISKTKDAQVLLEQIGKSIGKKVKKVTFALSPQNSETKRAIANIKGANIVSIFDINAYSVYTGGVVLLDKDGLEAKRPQKLEEKEEISPAKGQEPEKPKIVKKIRKVTKKSK